MVLFGIMASGMLPMETMQQWTIVNVDAAETLAAPKLVSAKQVSGTTNLKLTWKAVDDAKGYCVYRKTSGTGWKLLKKISGAGTLSYVDKACTAGTTYVYTVRAYQTKNGSEVLGSYNKSGIAGIVLKAPTLVSVTPGADAITIEWKPLSYASGYYVYGWDSEDGWYEVAKVSGKNVSLYKDTECSIGDPQYYTVSAYKKVGNKIYEGNKNRNKIGTIVMEASKSVSATSTKISEITVNWTQVSGVDGYRVYRSTNGGSWSRIATISGYLNTSYKDTDVTLDTNYCYKVRAWRYVDGTKYWSDYTTGKMITMKIPMPELISAKTKSTNSVEIKWKTVSGVYGYRVYRKTQGSATWNRLVTLTGKNTSSYIDTTAVTGETYIYTVRAYIRKNGANVWGYYDKTGLSVKIPIPAPKLVSATANGSSQIVLKWKKVDTASGYRIYMNQRGGWDRVVTLNDGSKTTYTITGLDADTTYSFTVRAYKTITGKKVWGKYDSTGIIGKTARGKLKLNYSEIYVDKGCTESFLKFEGTTSSPKWTSSDRSIAQVDEKGRVTGIAVGTATITAEFEGKKYKCKVIVENPTLSRKQVIVEVGESAYISLEGTNRDVKWVSCDEANYKMKVVDPYKIKITGTKIGREDVWVTIGERSLYCDVIVKGEIDVSKSKVTMNIGDTTEILITSSYTTIYVDGSEEVLNYDCEKIENGKWKLTLKGTAKGKATLKIRNFYNVDALCKKIYITVTDENPVKTNQYKLKNLIKNRGYYYDGWYIAVYTGYYQDDSGDVYIWSISYNETADEFEYGLTITSGNEVISIGLTGNPVKSSKMIPTFVYLDETTEKGFVAESSMNSNTYKGQKLTFKITESEGMKTSEMQEILSMANEVLNLGFGGWNEYLSIYADYNLKGLGFLVYPTEYN